MLKPPITAIILAGGKGTRMGGQDKGLMMLKNRPVYLHIIDKLQPQVSSIMINANRNQDIYCQSGYPVFADLMADYQGPLAGIYSGLYYAKTDWVLFVSCDTPFLPTNLVDKLWQQMGKHKIAYVYDGERNHPTLMLINKSQITDLKNYLDNNDRKLQIFLAGQDSIAVDFSEQKLSFTNINTQEELDYWNKQ
ncbi:molybdenum cofactor guanylyltransferase MobA [Zophobihabitans entericus]|uniref:Molybdenum cofactor guanylyltransferase n=1 Tax=Zophobihabitans entericus TaxID=1635327 RepID=A0A6G9I9I3_9GAMM|nr:molybdenum cofactor guanylyltransferase MobA [Zophobihabitans entericus]QIQ20489.1 molybdenum cofactor guanylyltransferase MobA [Zophobihabitans entericus]